MNKKIKNLSSHYIVCGGGETGRPVLSELDKNNESIVLIETNQETIEKCRTVIENLLFVDLLVLGVREKHQEIEFNPDTSTVVNLKTALIVMGDVNDYTKAKKWISQTS